MPTEPPPPCAGHVFVLFINGENEGASRAVEELRELCRRRHPGGCDLTVVDVAERPDLADEAGILATPTLVRMAPGPVRRVTGSSVVLP